MPKGKTEGTLLSSDGSEGNPYVLRSIVWSPDSKKLAAYRVRPGYHRKVNYVESSPTDQLQPKFMPIAYPKPGDAVDLAHPSLFLPDERRPMKVDNTLFPNPYQMSQLVW